MDILGYTVPVVARVGDEMALKVSTSAESYSARLVRLSGAEATHVPAELDGHVSLGGIEQPIRAGSYMEAPLTRGLPANCAVTAALWVLPTKLVAGRQCIMSVAGDSGAWELELRNGEARMVHADRTGSISWELSGGELCESHWNFVAACWDTQADRGFIISRPLKPTPTWPALSVEPLWTSLNGAAPLSYNRVLLGATDVGGHHRDHFNGKIDSPKLFLEALDGPRLTALVNDLAAELPPVPACDWRFSNAALAHEVRVPDSGYVGAHGVLRNLPLLGVTGSRWTGEFLSPSEAPAQYNAVYFHEDDLEDCEWQTAVAWRVPLEWESGVYGIVLEADGPRDVVPFLISAAGAAGTAPKGPLAVLIPTFSYLAYANEHKSWLFPIAASGSVPEEFVGDGDRYMAKHHLLSTYDFHTDGTGACFSSWRRPVLNFRHDYRMPLIRGPHGLSADLELLHWLDREGRDYELITDDDLHRLGAAALRGYRAIATGSHPEYWSARMLQGLAEYLSGGGRLAYLGGNGLYWVTTADAANPDVVEVRRGLAGTRVWQSAPGEEYHFMTGERGGVWRNRGWPPQRLTGVGFTAQGFDRALPYNWLIDETHPVAGFLARGIDTSAPLGATGTILGAAAGLEIDRLDYNLGSPESAVVVASAAGFSDSYQAAIEEFTTADSQQGGSVSELVRSDIVFAPLPGGGAMFSVGSISWCGSLLAEGPVSPVGTLMRNMLDRFLAPAPFE
jgi:N,N-dimethylformamidase